MSTILNKKLAPCIIVILCASFNSNVFAVEVWSSPYFGNSLKFLTKESICRAFYSASCRFRADCRWPGTSQPVCLASYADGTCYRARCSFLYKTSTSPSEGWRTSSEVSGSDELNPNDTVFNREKTYGPITTEQCVGNPVDIATGNKFEEEIDYVGSDSNSLLFQRFYNSYLGGRGAIGNKWRHTYERSITQSEPSVTIVTRHTGKVENYFLSATSNEWEPESDITGRLMQLTDGAGNNTGWEYRDEQDNVEAYDNEGKLISVTYKNALSHTLSYDTNYRLEEVADSFGRQLSFAYDTSDRIISMTDPDNNVYGYTYVGGVLTEVQYPDDTPQDQSDNPTRNYLYSEPNFTGYLTGITDENGNLYASWDYDDSTGEVILSEHGGSVDSITITYNTDGTTTITDGLGASDTFSFQQIVGVDRVTHVAGDQCSVCGAQAQAYTYDINGFINSQTDFEGNLTSFVNNTRGLQESRTEAVGTSEERTIMTEWHPDFRLPTKITEPGKETSFTYDTQGRLLSRTEREI